LRKSARLEKILSQRLSGRYLKNSTPLSSRFRERRVEPESECRRVLGEFVWRVTR
jgi:hypothetical protein